jgi:hypothetical protein
VVRDSWPVARGPFGIGGNRRNRWMKTSLGATDSADLPSPAFGRNQEKPRAFIALRGTSGERGHSGNFLASPPARYHASNALCCPITKLRQQTSWERPPLLSGNRFQLLRVSSTDFERDGGWSPPYRCRPTLYYNPSEGRFACLIFEATQHKWRRPKELCLAQRRQDRKGEHTAVLSSWRSLRLGERIGLGCGRRPRRTLGAPCGAPPKGVASREGCARPTLLLRPP